jgi:serine protease AprX
VTETHNAPRFHTNYPRHHGYTILPTAVRCGTPETITGRGVTIAFIDSGFYPHPDLGDRVLCHADATSGRVVEGRRFHKPEWFSWHGQMTSVVAAGAGDTFPGIARDAKLVLIKVSNRLRQIKERDILRGFDWLLANHQRFNVRVVNVSVGGDFESFDAHHPLHRIVARLTAEGVTVCIAAGNHPQPHLVPPASAVDAITVGGYSDNNTHDSSHWHAYGSSWGRGYDGGAKPELIAPARWIAAPILPDTVEARRAFWLAQLIGESMEHFHHHDHHAYQAAVRHVLRNGYEDLGLSQEQSLNPDAEVYHHLQFWINRDKLIDATHQHVDGTSVSVAMVSAIVAQLIEVQPDLTPAQIKTLLMETAVRFPPLPHEQQGGGIINPAGALTALLPAQTAAD